MSWLGLVTETERRFSLRGIGDDRADQRRHPDVDGYMLARGTLLIEARMMPDARPHVLFGFDQTWPDVAGLNVHAIPGGGISVVQVAGREVSHGAVHHSARARAQILRISYAWDGPRRWARLTVERPESFSFASTEIDGAHPLPIAQLRNMIMRRGDTKFDRDVVFAALSDEVEPVGPMPSLAPQTLVETATGPRPAAVIKRGDLLLTRHGGAVPVLQKVVRCVPAYGSFAPLRLRAPYFGLLDDIIVTPHQRLVIDGSEVEYLFNSEAVLVPARHLENNRTACKAPAGPTAFYVQFILPRHDAISVAGTWVESLYIGRMRRDKTRFSQSLLAAFQRGTLPEHGLPAFPELQCYDAIHLARQRAA